MGFCTSLICPTKMSSSEVVALGDKIEVMILNLIRIPVKFLLG